METPPPAGLAPGRSPSQAHRVSATRWSVVSRAAMAGPCEQREQARDDICRNYWYPMYVYLRRKGHAATVAEDFVQGFFLELFEKNHLAAADPERGRFRTFLLTALQRYAAHRLREGYALKRGGNVQMHSLGDVEAETRYAKVAAFEATPEAAFDRAWAVTLLENVLASLADEYQDRADLFDALRPYLTADSQLIPYSETASRLGMTALNVKVTVHRLRARYRKLLDDQLRATLDDDGDLEEERAALIRAISGTA
jgi:RNA polymerase sigma factor (sigma-70 family)